MNAFNNETYFTQVKIMPRSRHYQERSVPKFLKKVFSILEENKFNDYISWSDDGKALIIKKPTEFAVQLLPLYFKHSNFSSFIRQLNMYKFRKSKTCTFDHIYTHPMFQRGRVDLLRNVQRKTADMGNEVPMDSPSFQAEEEDIDVERLIEENNRYKKIHKALTDQIEFVQKKMLDIKKEVTQLQNEREKAEANETFLRNVLKSLTKVYGLENIAKIIENDAEDSSELPSMFQETVQKEKIESAPLANNESISQVPESSYEEDGFLEKCSQGSQVEEYYCSTEDILVEKNQIHCNEGERQPLFALDFGFNVDLEDNDQDENSPRLTKIDSFVIWVDELKSKDYSAEMLFSQPNKRFHGDLNIEDF